VGSSNTSKEYKATKKKKIEKKKKKDTRDFVGWKEK
jgi:hypothetical protein